MKAHFRFIRNNKMKASFCFIESARRCRPPCAVATCWSRPALCRDLISAHRISAEVILLEHLRDWPNFLVFSPGCLHFHCRKRWLATIESAELATEKEFSFLALLASFSLASSFSQDVYCDDGSD
jgi:hypothetical protein